MEKLFSIMTDETWKDIKGYEGRYLISNYGRVKSVWHYHFVGIKERRMKKIYKEKYIAITDNGKGYKIVCLAKDGSRKNYYVHRLVAEHFLENKGTGNVVNHKDFNTNNNNVENLEWCTQKDNINYSISKGRGILKPRKTSTGESYIQLTKSGTYSVVIRKKGKRFKTLTDAVNYRNRVLEEMDEKISLYTNR